MSEAKENLAQNGEKPVKSAHIIDQDFGMIKGTSRVIIIGAAGTGKSVTMHYIAEGLHAQGVKINMLAPDAIRKLKKEGKLPEWLNLINYRYPKLPHEYEYNEPTTASAPTC